MTLERIAYFEIVDYMLTEHYRVNVGEVVLITGHNGSGKSSIISALRDVFEGGSNPAVIRKGTKRAIITIGLVSGVTIEKTITSKSYTVKVTGPDGIPLQAPQKFVNDLADSLSVDPTKLLAAKEKDIAKVLLEVMPISFGPEEIELAIGSRPDRGADLDGLEKLRKSLYELRTRDNVRLKEVQGSYQELFRTIPGGNTLTKGLDYNGEVKALEGTKANIEADRAGYINAAREKHRSQSSKIQVFLSQKIQELRDEANAAENLSRDEQDAELSRIQAEYGPLLEKKTEELTLAKRNAAEQLQIEERRKMAASQQDRAVELQRNADRLTTQIEALDGLKRSKLANLPISGLSFSDGVFRVDGQPWELVNKTRRAEIAYQIVMLRAGRLPFILQDDAEFLDPDMWAAFLEFLKDSGYQIVAAKVSGGPLKIETQVLAAA